LGGTELSLVLSTDIAADLSQLHPIRNTSQQQHRWTIPEAVVKVICS